MVDELPNNRANSNFPFRGVVLDHKDTEKRRVINLLPGVNQTSTLQKFFGSSVDHLFQPGDSRPVNGYIGRKPNYHGSKDYYLEEDTALRNFYQLEPAMLSKDILGETTNLLTYMDLLNNLRFQGGITNNHNRLFEQDFYSWAPAIDLDKFLNFREYFWLPDGPEIREVYGHGKLTIADGATSVFALPAGHVVNSVDEVRVLVDGVESEFNYTLGDAHIELQLMPVDSSRVEVFVASNIGVELDDTANFAFTGQEPLLSNQRIRIRNDRDAIHQDRIYVVEGVGQRIVLVPDDTPDLDLRQEYLVMARGCADGNPWSRVNRWFHKSVVSSYDKRALQAQQAKRPIVEFQRDLELYNYGQFRRPEVHLVSDNIVNIIDAISGRTQAARSIDGVVVDVNWITQNIPSGRLRILVTGDANTLVNNRVYQVQVVRGAMMISLISDGLDANGAPAVGEVVGVTMGQTYGNRDIYWDGSRWNFTQVKSRENQAPLFQLYDADGVPLQDAGRYPGSNFQGSRIIGYAPDTTRSSVKDPVLGFALVHDDKGEILFENFLATEQFTRREGQENVVVPGYYFHAHNDPKTQVVTFSNDWYNTGERSRQMVVDTFVAADQSRRFDMSQEPADFTGNPGPFGNPNVEVFHNNNQLVAGIGYIRQGAMVLIPGVKDGDAVATRTFNPANMSAAATGHYEIPLNLQANPGWEEVSRFTRGDLYLHLTQIIKAQAGFSGLEFSTNNWKDTAQVRNLGRDVVHHSAPLLRTMLLNSTKELDYMESARYSEREYARFRSKFEQKIYDFALMGKFAPNTPVETWVNTALDELSRGHTKDFPFYYSGMGATETRPFGNYIPATPSFLGLYPSFEPHVVTDNTLNGTSFIVGHDGSRTPQFGDIRDDAVLHLEQRIYESINPDVAARERPFFDYIGYVSGKFRQADYSREEFLMMLRAQFERWSSNYGIDYRQNDIFDIDDPFTWNWSSVRDIDNQPIPGNWRGIYRAYYDTDRPHTHPWEMLGFTTMPQWWTGRYGVAPFTSDNTLLWDELEAGYIHAGPRATESDPKWARPGLNQYIPVNSQGELLDPFHAGITRSNPTPAQAQKEWAWGDGSPAESAWLNGYWYPFAVAQVSYLMKPARFIETSWDYTNIRVILEGTPNEQIINRGAGSRQLYKEETVHTEILDDGTVQISNGVQQWIADYLISNNKSVTESLGNKIRGLTVQLAYKVGGFTDRDSLFVVSDTIDRVPQEDVNIELYKSPSIREEFYGGVIVAWTGVHWRIYGYNITEPVFKIISPDRNGQSATITTGTTQAARISAWEADTFYSVNSTVRFADLFYRCIRTHTSARQFETEYWQQVARPEYLNSNSVEYYLEARIDGYEERLPYGSIIKTPQEMADFISSYERHLENRGWVFDQLSADGSYVNDWRQAMQDFLKWAVQEEREAGDVIVLSPARNHVKFTTAHGAIQPVEQIINGVYSILDNQARPIIPENTNVTRHDDTIVIEPSNNQEIFATRLYVSEVEHIVVLNNTTIFQDVLYNPVYNVRQGRLRLQGFRTNNWKGRVDAPGFVVTSNSLVPNFEKSADDFRRLFDVEGIEQSDLRDNVRANIGFNEKEYMNNLLMSPTSQFEFYQGMIQQKGTKSAFRRLLRSNFIRHNEGLEFLEEWAFRVGNYGASALRPSLDVKLRQKDYKNNPQLIRFNGTTQGGWDQNIGWDMDHWDYLNPVESTSYLFTVNGVRSVNILSRGSKYTSIPKVTVNHTEGSGAILTPIMNWSTSTITGIVVRSGGSGFLKGDTIVAESPNGAGAVLEADSVDYRLSGIVAVRLDLPPGTTSAGSGYTVGTNVVFTGGNGSARARITSVDENGGITGIQLISGGGYYDETTTALVDSSNTSANPYIRADVAGGALKTIRIVSGGFNYDDKTTLGFTGRGRGATYTISISGGQVSGIRVENPGQGYDSSAIVAFEGGGNPVHAEAEVVVSQFPNNGSELLAQFKVLEGANLKEISVRVIEAFNGTQPSLSIGDGNDNGRYLDSIGLGAQKNFKLTLDKPGADPVRNIEEQIRVYVNNASSRGSVLVRMSWEFIPEYYGSILKDSDDDTVIDIYDLFAAKTGDYLFRDERWEWRHSTRIPDWATRRWDPKEKQNLPNAGYVHLDDIKWTSLELDEFLARFRDIQEANPSTISDHIVDLAYESNLAEIPQTQRHVLIPNINSGTYRIRNIVVTVDEAFPMVANTTATLSIGDLDEPEKFMPATTVNLNAEGETTHIVYRWVKDIDLDDNAIYLYFNQNSNLVAGPGRVRVHAVSELMGPSMMPGDRTWTYNTGIGDWSVDRLGDTELNVHDTQSPSFTGQGAMVSVGEDIFAKAGVPHDALHPEESTKLVENRLDRVIVDGATKNDIPTLVEVYKAKLKNSTSMYLDSNSLRLNSGSIRSQHTVMDYFASMGTVLNKITVSVSRPFDTPAGHNPVMTLGTNVDPERFARAVRRQSSVGLVDPSRPSFDYGKPITLDVWDRQVSIEEPTATGAFNVRVIRSGNIYVTPTAIRVKNGGYGYSQNSTPRVTVYGPTGVQASAQVIGMVVGYAVVNGGAGYTSTPTLTVTGGDGEGAAAIAEVQNGKIVNVRVPGTGTGTATANISNGVVTGINVSGATGWGVTPIVKLSGGRPSNHAIVEAQLSGTNISSVTVVDGGTGYASAPTVELLPHTGLGYTSAPRVLVSGGNGAGAVIEPIMLWRIETVNITNWGKCSWTGEGGNVRVEAPVDGAAPILELESTPSVMEPTEIHQWRYRIVSPESHPQFGQWVTVGDENSVAASFAPPSATNDPQYWLQSIALPIQNVDADTTYEVEIPDYVRDANGTTTSLPNVRNGIMGPSKTARITVVNTTEGENDIDLTRVNTKVFTFNEPLLEDDQIIAYFNPDGVTDGLVTVTVDYHHTTGFELFKMDGDAAMTINGARGGDIFTWNKVRFGNYDDLLDANREPVGGWKTGDRVLVDDGRTNKESAKLWDNTRQYEYDDLASFDGKVYRAIKSGSGAEFEVAIDNAGRLIQGALIKQGTLYTGSPTITIDGDGTGAVPRARLSPTRIYKVRVINGGSGYLGNETLETLVDPSGTGGGAVLRISRMNGTSIAEVEVEETGWNFDGSPTIQVRNDNRTGNARATFEAILAPTRLVAISFPQKGNDYTWATALVGTTSNTVGAFVPAEWELSSELDAEWRVFERTFVDGNTRWLQIRQEQTKINSFAVESAAIYNKHTNTTEQTLQLYDPYKGFIPAAAKRELNYILGYDPAIYTNGDRSEHRLDENNAWGADQVGQLWWDTSRVHYLDYEIDTVEYRWANWGKLAPGVTINVYEWTRSTQPPENWAAQVAAATTMSEENARLQPSGEVKDILDTPAFVVRNEYNQELGRVETVYYFWVRNVTTTSSNPSRELTSFQVTTILQNPTLADVPWFAVVDPDKIIVSGIQQHLTDEDSVLKVKWRLGENDGNDHKQWMLLREGDERNNIDDRLWNKMRDSLVGWDDSEDTVTVRATTKSVLVNSSTTLVLDSVDGLLPQGEINVGGAWIAYAWIYDNTLHGLSGIPNITVPAESLAYQTYQKKTPMVVPGPWLSDMESYGSAARPRQTWFRTDSDSFGRRIPSREARRSFVESINNIFSREAFLYTRFEWREVMRASDPLPVPAEYTYVAPDLVYRDVLAAQDRLKKGQRVLIENLESALGFWTLWTYDPQHPDADDGGFVIAKSQAWRLQEGELWEAVDWYAEGWSRDDFPVRRFATRADRDTVGRLDVTLLKGTLVQVDRQDAHDPNWSWSIYTDNGWTDVARGKGTIRLKDNFWLDGRALYGFGSFDLDTIQRRDGSWELRSIIDNVRTKMLTGKERNELFFNMVHVAQSQHSFTDWAFKTSFLYLAGYKEELAQNPVTQKDQLDNLIAYIDDVKPYHVKLRDVVRRLATPLDVINLHVTDFDKPLYYDPLINNQTGGWRILDPNNPVDIQILSTQMPFKDWYDNYLKTNYDRENWDDQWNPIRRPKINIILDRVSCEPIIGWDNLMVPWDAVEERWTGTQSATSFIRLSNQYRKYPLAISEWLALGTDYSVSAVNAVTHLIEGRTFVDVNASLATAALKAGQIVVLRTPGQPNVPHSAWRRVGASAQWEVFEYRRLAVAEREDLDTLARDSRIGVGKGEAPLLQTGDIVTVLRNDSFWIFTGTQWIEFNSAKWDQNWAGGLADRIDQFYDPQLGQKRKELKELIRGCSFRGTVVEGSTLEQGVWDVFAWDHPSGWDNEFDYYVGRDVELNPTALDDGSSKLSKGDTWRLDAEGNTVLHTVDFGDLYLVNDKVYNAPKNGQLVVEANRFSSVDGNGNLRNGPKDEIAIEGNEFAQPWFEGGHPDELLKARIRNPLMITVYDNGTNKPQSTAMRWFRDATGAWEIEYLEEEGFTLAADVKPTDRQVTINTNGNEIHDPFNPSLELLKSVSPNVVFDIPAVAIAPDLKKKTKVVSYKRRDASEMNWNLTWTMDELLALWVEPEAARNFTPEYSSPEEKAVVEALEAETAKQKKIANRKFVIEKLRDLFAKGDYVWLFANPAQGSAKKNLTAADTGRVRGIVDDFVIGRAISVDEDNQVIDPLANYAHIEDIDPADIPAADRDAYTHAGDEVIAHIRKVPEVEAIDLEATDDSYLDVDMISINILNVLVKEAGSSIAWSVIPERHVVVPGVLWIDAERLSYMKLKDNGDGTVTLGDVRRGVGSTSYGATDRSLTEFFTVNPTTTSIGFSDGLWDQELTHLRVSVMSFDPQGNPLFWVNQAHGHDYTVSGNQIVFANPPLPQLPHYATNDHIRVDIVVADWNSEEPVSHGMKLDPVEMQRLVDMGEAVEGEAARDRRVYVGGYTRALTMDGRSPDTFPHAESVHKDANDKWAGGLVDRRKRWEDKMQSAANPGPTK